MSQSTDAHYIAAVSDDPSTAGRTLDGVARAAPNVRSRRGCCDGGDGPIAPLLLTLLVAALLRRRRQASA